MVRAQKMLVPCPSLSPSESVRWQSVWADASLFLLLSGQRPCFVLILKDLPGEEDNPEENKLQRRYLVTY